MQRLTFLLILVLFTASAYGQKKEIYIHPNFQELTDEHVKIAVLPINVSITLHKAYDQGLSDEEFEQLKIDLSDDCQRSFEINLQDQKYKKAFKVKIQDTRTTNRILDREDINYYTVIEYSPQELAELLEVDAVIMGSLNVKSKSSLLLATTLFSIAGISQNIQSSALELQLVNSKGKELWRYKNKIGRGLMHDEYTTSLPLLRKAARSLPYF